MKVLAVMARDRGVLDYRDRGILITEGLLRERTRLHQLVD